MRPEILIPLSDAASAEQPSSLPTRFNDETASEREIGSLEIGAPVRIIREPNFGSLGTVTGMPHEPRLLESESFARVVEVKLANGSPVIVPRANVELIEG